MPLRTLLAALLICGVLAAQQTAGRRLFEAQCALCHGQNGGGGRGPSLLKPKLNKAPDQAALVKLIENGIEPEMPGAWTLSPKELTQVAEYVRSLGSIAPEIVPGDPAAGKEVYGKSGCASCHIVEGMGSGYGPELSNIGGRRNAAHLRQSILKPDEMLPDGFMLLTVSTRQGPTTKGIRLAEDLFSVQLMDARGQLHSFRKAEASITQTPKKSPMPAYPNLPAADLDNLIAYLASLKGSPQ
jgi:putative heme-binding domain-containing protein